MRCYVAATLTHLSGFCMLSPSPWTYVSASSGVMSRARRKTPSSAVGGDIGSRTALQRALEGLCGSGRGTSPMFCGFYAADPRLDVVMYRLFGTQGRKHKVQQGLRHDGRRRGHLCSTRVLAAERQRRHSGRGAVSPLRLRPAISQC